MKDFCYWSIGDGDYACMLQTMVHSARHAGVREDFYVFSDKEIEGAVTLPCGNFDKSFYLFKFAFLKNVISKLPYRFFVFLDADNFFVRKPSPFLSLMEDTPLHIFLESDCTTPSVRKEWHKCPLPKYVDLMRECGVTSEKIYTVNAGFFIVKRESIDLLCAAAADFWNYSMQEGFLFTEEPPLAYAMQLLCKNESKHLLKNYPNLWCSDWTGHFENHLPDGSKWLFEDYLNEQTFQVNPAIVHALKSKKLLLA